MNILVAVVDNGIGGIQNRLLMIGKKLHQKDIYYTILAPKGGGNFTNLALKESLKAYQIDMQHPKFFSSYKNFFGNILWAIYFPIAVHQTVRIIKQDNIDIVHVNGLLAIQPAIAAKLCNKPLIWHLIGTLYPKILINLLVPFIRLIATKIIFVSHKTKEYYLPNDSFHEKCQIIYEPVDIEYFNKNYIPESRKKALRNLYSIDDGTFIIGTVCDISPIKNLESFIEVAFLIKKINIPKISFLIIGGPGSGNELYSEGLNQLVYEKGLDNYVFFTGSIPYKSIRDYYSLIDVFLMTSLSEGTPLVILEAMSMEIPVISTNVGGISEQVIDGETGFLVSDNSPYEIVEYLQRLIDNYSLRYEMAKKGKKWAAERFSLKKCEDDHIQLYYNALAQFK